MRLFRLLKYKISKYVYNVYTRENKLTEGETIAVQIFQSLLFKPDCELTFIPISNKKFIHWGKYTAVMDDRQLTIITKTQYYSIALPFRVIEKLTRKFNQKLSKTQIKIEGEIDETVSNRLTTLIDDIKVK